MFLNFDAVYFWLVDDFLRFSKVRELVVDEKLKQVLETHEILSKIWSGNKLPVSLTLTVSLLFARR